jgi:DNA-binding GntR family transcriptional regulator
VPQRGLQIAHVDLKLINNAFQLRLLLEREAATRFCTTVSDADLATIEDAHRRIVQRARAGPIDDTLLTDATTVDWGLHDLMIDALGNELISEVYRINSLRVRLIRLEASALSPEALVPAMEEHLWFVQALKARDPAEVAARLTHHIESAHRRVLGLPRPALPGLDSTLATTRRPE